MHRQRIISLSSQDIKESSFIVQSAIWGATLAQVYKLQNVLQF